MVFSDNHSVNMSLDPKDNQKNNQISPATKKSTNRNNALTLVQDLAINNFFKDTSLASGEGHTEIYEADRTRLPKKPNFLPNTQSYEVRVSIIKKTITHKERLKYVL